MGERPSGNASCPIIFTESILRAFARNPDVTQQAAQIALAKRKLMKPKVPGIRTLDYRQRGAVPTNGFQRQA